MVTRRSRDGKTKGGGRMFHRGAEGRKRVDKELEKQKKKREAARNRTYAPLRFYVPVGETKEIVILDDKPEFFLYEHNTKFTEGKRRGRWGNHLICIDEWANCPVCEEYGDPSYVMFLSVLDFTPYTDKNNVRHEYSRKLLAIKPAQQKKFLRKYEKEGTLRGATFECSRDGDKDAAIGNDIEHTGWMDEEDLETGYIKKFKDREGNRKSENHGEPYDYEALFTEPTEEELQILMGREPQPGSRRESSDTLDEDEDEKGTPWKDDDDGAEEEWESKPRKKRSTRKSASRRKAGDEDEDEEEEKPRRKSRRKSRDDDDDEEEAPRTRRGRSRRSSEEDEEEEEKPRRKSRRTSRDDDDEEDDGPPRRGARRGSRR